MFVQHTYLVHSGRVFDSCLGPHLGNQVEADYLPAVIETALSGYYSTTQGPGVTGWVLEF
ncbi:MAG: hypothetical protein AB7O52_16155 [Planctomycetota bacterium]